MKSSLGFNERAFADYLEDLVKAGKDIDAAADAAIKVGGEILLSGMFARAPFLTGELRGKITMIGPENDNGYHYAKIGVYNVNRETEMYFFYQENGSPRNAAHPYIRTTFHQDGQKARKAMINVMKEMAAL